MKNYLIFANSSLKMCEYKENIPIGSVKCTNYCEFVKNLETVSDHHGRLEYITFKCSYKPIKKP